MAQDPKNKPPPIVQKISPYPIAVEVLKVEGQPPLKESIVKITDIGFLMKVEANHFYKVGENIHLVFTLPVVHATVRADGKVVKTYDAIESLGNKKTAVPTTKLYTVEVHFKKMLEKEKEAISSYLVKSGQKKF